MKAQKKFRQWLIIGLLLAGMGLTVSPALAGSGLPPRDPPPPVQHDHDNGPEKPVGAAIELVAPGYAGQWSAVQWQDSNGDWQTVEGWQGSLDERGVRRWWVAAKDFGTGPFRWVVGDTTQPGAISNPFNLPAVGAATLVVTISSN